ncbi:Kalirin isoform X7 [Aix galericulata]|nr:Kalirin isoform X7 [Aix galericulata]
MKAGRRGYPARSEAYSVSSNDNGSKSDSVANLQPQPSLNSIQSSPGPKRSTNTLKKWLTSPVRRLNSGKAESNIKKQKKVRDGRKSFDLGSPKTGDETTPQGDSADEKSKKGWGEDEPDEESHTPLPPPMKIFDNDPTQDEMTLEGGSYRGTLKDATGCLNEGMTPSTPPRNLEEEQKAKAMRGRMFVLNELVQTEKDYVKDLGTVVEGFMKRIEEKGVSEDMKGKDKIVFGNIHQIYDWHKDFFLAELEKCLQEHDRLAQLFIKHDFLRYSEKAGLECSDIEGKLTAQGKLLQQDTFYVTEQDSGVQSRPKERRVFLFEQIVIFSELLRKGSLTPGYMFKKSIKMNYLIIEENVDNDPCKFALMSRETSERVILQAANPEIQQAWVQDINQVLDTQRDFLNALQSPIEYQRKESSSAVLRPQTVGSEKPLKATSRNPSLPPLKISTSNGSTEYEHSQPGDKYEQSKTDLGGCNGTSSMVVIKDYYALKEDEICVNQGEVVQILAINQQNMFLVYQPANDHSPAAEGWIPGNILAPLTKSTTDSSDGSIK